MMTGVPLKIFGTSEIIATVTALRVIKMVGLTLLPISVLVR
jgi:hypothetical protein